MPKGTHFHVNHDTLQTDKKFRPEDGKIYSQDKREVVDSEAEKREDTESPERVKQHEERKEIE